jgi:hypothetical protein
LAAKTIVFGYEPLAINLFAYGNSGAETTAGNPEISIIAFLSKKGLQPSNSRFTRRRSSPNVRSRVAYVRLTPKGGLNRV